jgi:1-acyl-sn-glycerol-3-phosphate acyltransferase
MNRSLRVIWVALILFLTTLVLLPFHFLAILFQDRAANYAPHIWHKVACWSLGIKITYKGKISRDRPLMIVSNHVSWLDILVLGASAPLVFIAKSEVRDWPVFGVLAKLQRSVFIERHRRGKTGEQVSTIAQRMKQGDVVVLFPEGTTSDGNFILPFKSALFGAAQSAQEGMTSSQLTIQPVCIAYCSAHGIPLGRAARHLAAWPGDVPLLPHVGDIIAEGSLGIEITFSPPLAFEHPMKRSEIARLCEESITSSLNSSLRP